MATLNLGRIKPVFRGAYSGSTAYVVDDIVTHGNETFICIQAHGAGTQATSQTAYWTKLAAKGTDGTDVGTTITTQGDILYRDGSGLQRLAKGTAGQALKMNSGATAPEWGTISSDFVKITHLATNSGSSATINLQSVFDDSVYNHYMLVFNYRINSNASIKARFLNGSSAYSGGTDYRRNGRHMYRRNDNSEAALSQNNDGNGVDHMSLMGWGHNSSYNNYALMDIGGELNTANGDFPRKYCLVDAIGVDNSGGSAGVYWWGDQYWHHFSNNGAVDGIQITADDTIGKYSLTLWGLKK